MANNFNNIAFATNIIHIQIRIDYLYRSTYTIVHCDRNKLCHVFIWLVQ